MRVLVTGGAGFIGSAVCRALVALGHDVLNIDKFTYAATEGALATIRDAPTFRLLRADVCDHGALSAAFADFQPGAVMHLAAETHVDRSIIGPQAFINTNVLGAHSLLEVTRDYLQNNQGDSSFRLIFVSTDEVFGALGESGSFDESSAYAPRSPYAATKAAADHLASAWAHTYGVPLIFTHCSNTFGPFQFPEKLIPLAIAKACDGDAIPVYGDGRNVRDWLFLEDHVAALTAVLDRGSAGRRYLIGARNERRNIDVVQALCAALDDARPDNAPHDRFIRFVPDRPGHDFRYAVDPSRTEEELGWRAATPFAEGLRRTVDWYLANEAWWRPLRARIRADASAPAADRTVS